MGGTQHVQSHTLCLQLTEYKERCEWALEVKRSPQEVVIECLALREQRSDIDLVADVTESQLKKVLLLCMLIVKYSVASQVPRHPPPPHIPIHLTHNSCT